MDHDAVLAADRAADVRLRAKLGTRGFQKNDGGWCGCSECPQVFNSLYGFDKHRRTGVCMTPGEMLAAGWFRNKYGRWISEAMGEVLRTP